MNSGHKHRKYILQTLPIIVICWAASGCANWREAMVESAITSSLESDSQVRRESEYDKTWRKADEEWQRKNYGY